MRKIASEMIIVDTGSTDRTVELAKAANAKLYFYKWENDFAAAKNFALDKATGNWIFFLDADEYFSEQTIHNVLPFIARININKKIDAIISPRLELNMDENNRYMGTSQVVRIFRNSLYLRYEGKIHEALMRQNGNLRLIEPECKIEICHTGYSHTIIRNKLKRNLEILQEEIAETGENRRHYLYLLDCYYGLEDYTKAVYYAKKSIDEKLAPLGQECMPYRRWIDSLVFAEAEIEELLNVVDIAIEKYPDLPEFYWNKGKFLFDQKDYVKAETYFRKALEKRSLGKTKGGSGTFETKLNFLYYLLGEVCRLKGNIENAVTFFVTSLEFDRYNKTALMALYKSIRLCDPVDIIEIFQHLYNGKVEQDMEFVISVLIEYPLDRVYLYYEQILYKNFNQKIENNIFAGLCAAQNYKKALLVAAVEVEQAYHWLIISTVTGGKQQSYEIAKTLLPITYQNVLNFLLEKDEKVLSLDERTIYDDICTEIKKLDSSYKCKEEKIIEFLKEKAVGGEEKQWFVKLLSEKIISNEMLVDLIMNNFPGEESKTLIDTAVMICNEDFAEIGINIIETAYDKNTENDDILYAYVFLLHVYGADQKALEIIKQAKQVSEELSVLAQQIIN